MNKVFVFLLGAATGSLVTWGIVKRVYERIADEEIENVVDYYRSKEEIEELEEENDIGLTDEEIDEAVYESKLEMLGYQGESKDLGKEIDDDDCIIVTPQAIEFITPYVIAPEEFGDAYDYDKKSWTLYADGVLTDEVGNIVFEPEKYIGDALEHFGDYEEDAVHVRNDNEEWDIEILKHEKTFTEINGEDS